MSSLSEAEENFLKHDWANDTAWSAYFDRLEPTPPLKNVAKWRRKYYRQKVDPSLPADSTVGDDAPPPSPRPAAPKAAPQAASPMQTTGSKGGASSGDPVRALQRQAAAAMKGGEHKEAVKHYSEALRLMPSGDETMFAARSLCWLQLDKPALALTDASRCLEMNCRSTTGHLRKAQALASLRRWGECMEHAMMGLALDPDAKDLLEMEKTARGHLPSHFFTTDPGPDAPKGTPRYFPNSQTTEPDPHGILRMLFPDTDPLYRQAVGEWRRREDAKALQLFEQAAEKGNTASMNFAAHCYCYGYGTALDTDKCWHWLRKLVAMPRQRRPAAGGSKITDAFVCDGMSAMAIAYMEGVGVERDFEQAEHWFLEACRELAPRGSSGGGMKGNANIGAMNGLAQLYENSGMYDKARRWYRRLVDLGHLEAAAPLANLLVLGKGGPVDIAGAKTLILQVVQKGAAGAGALFLNLGAAGLVTPTFQLGQASAPADAQAKSPQTVDVGLGAALTHLSCSASALGPERLEDLIANGQDFIHAYLNYLHKEGLIKRPNAGQGRFYDDVEQLQFLPCGGDHLLHAYANLLYMRQMLDDDELTVQQVLGELKTLSAKGGPLLSRVAILVTFLGLKDALLRALPGHTKGDTPGDATCRADDEALLDVLRVAYFQKRKLPERLKEALKYMLVSARARDNYMPGSGSAQWMQIVEWLVKLGQTHRVWEYIEKASKGDHKLAVPYCHAMLMTGLYDDQVPADLKRCEQFLAQGDRLAISASPVTRATWQQIDSFFASQVDDRTRQQLPLLKAGLHGNIRAALEDPAARAKYHPLLGMEAFIGPLFCSGAAAVFFTRSGISVRDFELETAATRYEESKQLAARIRAAFGIAA